MTGLAAGLWPELPEEDAWAEALVGYRPAATAVDLAGRRRRLAREQEGEAWNASSS